MPYETREQWLNACIGLHVRAFEVEGFDLPKIRIACGFPSVGATRRKNKRIGECWYSTSSTDSTFEILISPVIDSIMEVSAIVAHELCHAVLPAGTGHRAPFKRLAKALGLEGKATATYAGDDYKARYGSELESLGEYPHAALNPNMTDRKKQSTRMIKASCSDCGYTVRLSRKWLMEAGSPLCPTHETAMIAD